MSRNRKKNREKKRILGRIERNKKTIFGDTDLTPFNVVRRDIAYK